MDLFILLVAISAAVAVYFFKNKSQAPIDNDNVIVIGLPGAGKTVFFCVSMDVFQRKCNDMDDDFGVVFEEHRTERMVRHTVDVLLRNQKWPENTSGSDTHRVSVFAKGKKVSLVYKDYSGEAFMKAFGDSAAVENTLPETTGETGAEAQFEKELLKEISSARGIVLVLDASLILDVVNMQLSACLFNLLTQIKNSDFSGKLALVFAKGDLIRDIQGFSVEEAFKNQQPNSFARLREIGRRKRGSLSSLTQSYGFTSSQEKERNGLFLVIAVKCVVNDDGVPVPPKDYSSVRDSENVLAPLCWLLGLEEDAFHTHAPAKEEG